MGGRLGGFRRGFGIRWWWLKRTGTRNRLSEVLIRLGSVCWRFIFLERVVMVLGSSFMLLIYASTLFQVAWDTWNLFLLAVDIILQLGFSYGYQVSPT